MAGLNHYYSSTPVDDVELPWYNDRIEFRLLSCHDGYFGKAKKWCQDYTRRNADKPMQTLLLDSGAFTAWNKGHPATLEALLPKYAYFVENHAGDVKDLWLINLDKIPAEPGRDPTPAELDDAMETSDRNFERLVSEFGARVMPVFHQGESIERLHVVEDQANYICVSPRNDLGEGLRVQWAADTHAKLRPGTRTHGLAATGVKMMTQVPWTSVDSASMMFLASSGQIRCCVRDNWLIVPFSEKSELRKIRGKHFDSMSEGERFNIMERLAYHGFTLAEMQDWKARARMTFLETEFWLENIHRFDINKQQGLF